tara:strand:+ start:1651 stop:2076 length:426 start_codon:yes stop_codon:yes gene_type:complete
MPPFWPFKKKEDVVQLEEAPPAPIVYKRGEDPNARPDVEADAGAYKDALALFGDGSQKVEAASDQSVHYDGVTATQPQAVSPLVETNEAIAPAEEAPTSKEESEFSWVHHTDGYHYKQRADGSFEPTPHTKNEDGTYSPYS